MEESFYLDLCKCMFLYFMKISGFEIFFQIFVFFCSMFHKMFHLLYVSFVLNYPDPVVFYFLMANLPSLCQTLNKPSVTLTNVNSVLCYIPLFWLTSCWPSAGWAAPPKWLGSRKGTRECQGNTGTDRGSTLVQTEQTPTQREKEREAVSIMDSKQMVALCSKNTTACHCQQTINYYVVQNAPFDRNWYLEFGSSYFNFTELLHCSSSPQELVQINWLYTGLHIDTAVSQ